MDDFESLKEIWLSEKAERLPNSEEIKSAMKKYHTSKKRNIYLLILGVILCFIIMILIVIFAETNHWTRVFGEIIMFLGVFFTLLLKLKTLKKANENELKSNQEFLEELKISSEKKSKLNNLQLITILLIGIGYGLFIYQDIFQNKNLMILSYLGIFVFLTFMYFIFRPFAENLSRKKSEILLKTISDFNN